MKVILDRLLADKRMFRDLPVGIALHYKRRDFAFPPA
jgi:hypothetical protein